MRAAALLLLSTITAPAQILTRPPAGDFPAGLDTLRCEVVQIKPVLNFSLRMQAGYMVSVPLNQYSGPGHSWRVMVRVTPQGGEAVYFGNRFRLPPVPVTKADGQVGGAYLVGEGHYGAALVVQDDSGRTCTREWQFDAQVNRAARNLQQSIPPATVQPLYARVNTEKQEPVFDRLTVFLHAAPVRSRAPKLQTGDIVMWLGEVSALLQQVPARSVRLVVFNLAQQKELFREDAFHLEEMSRVSEVILGLQLALVDYHILQNRTGDAQLLAGLVNDELKSEKPADAVIFLGPRLRTIDKSPIKTLIAPAETMPRFFYVDYRNYPSFGEIENLFPALAGGDPMPAPGRGMQGDNDIISALVSIMKGKTMDVHSPADFAKAIQRITGKK